MKNVRRAPIAGDVILAARLRKGMTQEEVQAKCLADHDTKVYNLSRMENGDIRWPSPKVLPALAAVLELRVEDLLATVAA